MMTAKTDRKYFSELSKKPLFFMEQIHEVHEKQNSDCTEDYYFYKSTRTEISAFISEKNIVNNILHLKCILLVAENEVEHNQNKPSNTVTFSFHIANPQYEYDWAIILKSLIIPSSNSEDKFPFIYTLWFLNHSDWNIEQLKYAIEQYDIKVLPYIFKWLQRICRCLSYQKQKQIKEVANFFNFEYEIYFPPQITEALKYVTPTISETNYNLFDLIDLILGDKDKVHHDKYRNIINPEFFTDSSNDFICLYVWFISDKPLKNYHLLKSIYSLVSCERQLKIIQRYFHDVRLGNVSFDANIIKQFRDNNYEEFTRYRYCINTPDCKINIGNKLLCDCILTLIETKGKSFQSFNGILDIAINHCNTTNPKIDLGLDNFLPCCDGGAIYNDKFQGFIDYSIIICLDNSKFTSENLSKTIKTILDSKGVRKNFYTCKYDNNQKVLDETSNCLKLGDCLKLKGKPNCITSAKYEDKWIVSSNDYGWLNLFIKEPIVEKHSNKKIEISMADISTEKMKDSIHKIAFFYEDEKKPGTCIIHSKDINSFMCKLLFYYSIPKAMRIYPQTQIYIGPIPQVMTQLKSYRNSFFDPFNIKNTLATILKNERFLQEFCKKESSETTKRVISSLNTILKNGVYNGVYYETTYDKDLLKILQRLYYFKNPSIEIQKKDCELAFLKKKNTTGFPLFCAPKLDENHNQATNLPFFWCRGIECFHNALDTQCLQNNIHWRQYTLFHLSEIISFPKLYKVEGGYEPDGSISLLITIANKAMKKFIHLKCRACGHLMFPIRRNNFDIANYYSCINPSCSEYKKPVYLNYCYKCKKGFIDSRDTKQCPNDWYICPTCLSCCDDKQYERLAQRYVISNSPIPNRIQSKIGKGHNDKGRYYCPTCGAKLDISYGKDNCFSAYCNSCKNTFNVSLK